MNTADERFRFAVAEMENDRMLFRDRLLYGTEFVDVTGKRIDPRTVSPWIADRAEPFKDIIDRHEKAGLWPTDAERNGNAPSVEDQFPDQPDTNV